MTQIALRSGRLMIDTRMEKAKGRLFFNFGFSKPIQAELKCMRGSYYSGFDDAKYEQWCKDTFGKREIWSVEDCPRNRFQLKWLMGGDPYANWERTYDGTPNRPEVRIHQWDLASSFLAVHYQIWAAEMGTGKTLAAIEAMEHSGTDDWWYVGPKSAIAAVQREFRIWGSKVIPKIMTYYGLKKEMKEWTDGKKPPHGVIFDEASKCKGITTETSQAAQALADGIRAEWGNDGYVLLMSGTPAPKSPLDWYSLCEIAYPGFIKEGDLFKFTNRLAISEKKEGVAGAQYKKLMFRTNPLFCQECGKFQEDHPVHTPKDILQDKTKTKHNWTPSIDEVSFLHERMQGLVKVLHKKDCMELPEKIYQVIQCKVSPDNARIAQMILGSTSRAAEALIKLREASDGFQYEDKVDGVKECDLCKGTGESLNPVEAPDGNYVFETGVCTCCNGERTVPNIVRSVREIPCPKDEALEDLLDLHFEDGRIVIYAGFQASLDKVERICQAKKWATIRYDGRGLKVLDADGNQIIGEDFLDIFQKLQEKYPQVAFIGQPGAAGMGLTLTASKSVVYFSNTFGGEDRIQSEDRIHRFGCRGANIFDIVHFPTDKYVLANLKLKRELQSLTLGEIVDAMKGKDV